jgi:hypothetical protein
MCGYNGDGQSYCVAHLGDKVGQQYLQQVKSFLKSGSLEMCNTTRRYKKECWELIHAQSEYQSFMLAKN